MQDALGTHQDAVTLRHWLDALPLRRGRPGVASTAGRLHQAVAASDGEPPPWRPSWRKAGRTATGSEAGLGG